MPEGFSWNPCHARQSCLAFLGPDSKTVLQSLRTNDDAGKSIMPALAQWSGWLNKEYNKDLSMFRISWSIWNACFSRCFEQICKFVFCAQQNDIHKSFNLKWSLLYFLHFWGVDNATNALKLGEWVDGWVSGWVDG